MTSYSSILFVMLTLFSGAFLTGAELIEQPEEVQEIQEVQAEELSLHPQLFAQTAEFSQAVPLMEIPEKLVSTEVVSQEPVVPAFVPEKEVSMKQVSSESVPTELVRTKPVSQERVPGELVPEKQVQKKRVAVKPVSKKLLATVKQELAYLAKNRGPFKLFPYTTCSCCALSYTGRFYAVGLKAGDVVIGSAVSGKEQRRLSGHTAVISWIAFSPDDSKVLTCSNDTTAKLWDRSTGEVLHTLSGHGSILFTGSFNPEGTRIVTGSADRTVSVWNVETGKRLITFPLGFYVDAVSFCDKGKAVCATSLNGMSKRWDRNGEELFSARGPRGPLAVSEFNRTGTNLFSGTFVGTVIIWDPLSGKTQKTIDLGSHLKIFALAMSKKATMILAGCSDGTGRVIRRASGKECMRLIGARSALQSVAISLEKQRALTVSSKGRACLYNLSVKPLNRLKASLTSQQAAFLKEAYAAHKKGNPFPIVNTADCETLMSFGNALVPYLKEAFLLAVDPACEKATKKAQDVVLH